MQHSPDCICQACVSMALNTLSRANLAAVNPSVKSVHHGAALISPLIHNAKVASSGQIEDPTITCKKTGSVLKCKRTGTDWQICQPLESISVQDELLETTQVNNLPSDTAPATEQIQSAPSFEYVVKSIEIANEAARAYSREVVNPIIGKVLFCLLSAVLIGFVCFNIHVSSVNAYRRHVGTNGSKSFDIYATLDAEKIRNAHLTEEMKYCNITMQNDINSAVHWSWEIISFIFGIGLIGMTIVTCMECSTNERLQKNADAAKNVRERTKLALETFYNNKYRSKRINAEAFVKWTQSMSGDQICEHVKDYSTGKPLPDTLFEPSDTDKPCQMLELIWSKPIGPRTFGLLQCAIFQLGMESSTKPSVNISHTKPIVTGTVWDDSIVRPSYPTISRTKSISGVSISDAPIIAPSILVSIDAPPC